MSKLKTEIDIQGHRIVVFTTVPRPLLEVEDGRNLVQQEHDTNVGRAVRIHCQEGRQYRFTPVNHQHQDAMTARINTVVVYTVIEDADDAHD